VKVSDRATKEERPPASGAFLSLDGRQDVNRRSRHHEAQKLLNHGPTFQRNVRGAAISKTAVAGGVAIDPPTDAAANSRTKVNHLDHGTQEGPQPAR